MKIGGKKRLIGNVKIPGDKSISHRSVILGSIAKGRSEIYNILGSDDILNTINIFKSLGVKIFKEDKKLIIEGKGLYGLQAPKGPLECGNSGTTLRLLAGLLSGQKFKSDLSGDKSLNNRPMKRIIDPLSEMGANVKSHDYKPPLTIEPVEKLSNIDYSLPIASAQVKSSILLASLYTQGKTVIYESRPTRNHTEIMLEYFGADIEYKQEKTSINNPSDLQGQNIYVPGDISSAAYFIVGALIMDGSEIVIENVGLNPTRSGIIDILMEMGANIEVGNIKEKNKEVLGDIRVKSSKLSGIEIHESLTPNLIDEIPILAVAASFAKGRTLIKGVEELRHKETDRLTAICNELNTMGGNLEAIENNLLISGVDHLREGSLDSYGDHRIAMALSIAALNTVGKSNINNIQCVRVSYPNFYEDLFSMID